MTLVGTEARTNTGWQPDGYAGIRVGTISLHDVVPQPPYGECDVLPPSSKLHDVITAPLSTLVEVQQRGENSITYVDPIAETGSTYERPEGNFASVLEGLSRDVKPPMQTQGQYTPPEEAKAPTQADHRPVFSQARRNGSVGYMSPDEEQAHELAADKPLSAHDVKRAFAPPNRRRDSL